MLHLSDPLEKLPNGNPRLIAKLKKLGLAAVKDLLYYFPFRYDDFSTISKIKDVKIGDTATVQGKIKNIQTRRTWQKRMFITEALVGDETGDIKAVWFNQPYITQQASRGKTVNLAGKIIQSKGAPVFQHPNFEIVTDDKETAHTGKIVAIYGETKGLTSKGIRYLVSIALRSVSSPIDIIPKDILVRHNLPPLAEALRAIHAPKTKKDAGRAKRRFAFEDLFLLQLCNICEKAALAGTPAPSIKAEIEQVKKLLALLPFELTLSQKKSLWEIIQDIGKNHPMNRLLQGDVGSGKTIVAGIAAILTAKKGLQTAFMAPTEILARQHYQTIMKLFPVFEEGLGLLTGSEARVFYGVNLETEIKKAKLTSDIEAGRVKIVFGTHALIQKTVNFGALGLVVIDEQHRFGVRQRSLLLRHHKESALFPHLLSMSATPIPRTLSLTLFGDLDLSLITELPKNRKPIETRAVSPRERTEAYQFIREQVKQGRQAFVICPRIEKPEDKETAESPFGSLRSHSDFSNLDTEVKSVKEEYDKLSKKIFPNLKVSMLHGKMKPKEKEMIMRDFKEGRADILVSTSVIEVGVDVPNAAIMMIESAECFGLAQLYQFRGRVGRGEHQSYCFLFTEADSYAVRRRLLSIVETKNGLELAEKDLKMRGPGEFLGEIQTGMPDLAMKALQNPDLVKTAREEAREIFSKDPRLVRNPLLKSRLETFRQETHWE